MQMRAQDIADWLREHVTAAGAQGLVVGLSGGVDSAVVARLCQLATPDRVVAVIMPCHGDPRDEEDARLVVQHFKLPAVHVDLQAAYDRFAGDLDAAIAKLPPGQRPAPTSPETDSRTHAPRANMKPRLRMTALYFFANSLNHIVAGTGNRCELALGYFTKFGDGAVDVLPIGHLLKSEVRALARALDVPAAVIDKAPSAGLWPGQTDEAEMGVSYAALERYLQDGPDAVPPAMALRIERLIRQTEHKRAPIPTPAAS